MSPGFLSHVAFAQRRARLHNFADIFEVFRNLDKFCPVARVADDGCADHGRREGQFQISRAAGRETRRRKSASCGPRRYSSPVPRRHGSINQRYAPIEPKRDASSMACDVLGSSIRNSRRSSLMHLSRIVAKIGSTRCGASTSIQRRSRALQISNTTLHGVCRRSFAHSCVYTLFIMFCQIYDRALSNDLRAPDIKSRLN